MYGKDFDLMMSQSSQAQLVKPRSKKTRMVKTTNPPINDGRHRVLHNYHDHSQVPFTSENDTNLHFGGEGDERKGPRGGVTVPFPTKLHVMLSKVEDEGLSHIVSWQPHGRCFVVHKPKEFVSEVMSKYFRQSKLTSFQRQLNLYGFSRITAGKDRSGYYHEHFLRHKLFLCQNMPRIRIKGTGIKGKPSPETEPDFYSMPWVVPEDVSRDLSCEFKCKVTAAMEDENKRVNPTQKKHRDRTSRIHSTTRKDSIQKHSQTDHVYSSPRSTSTVFAHSAVVTPNTTRTIEHTYIPPPLGVTPNTNGRAQFRHQLSSDRIGRHQKPPDICPPFLSSHLDNNSNKVLHLGDEIAFEGKHFHYLDSCPAPDPLHFLSLEPRKKTSPTQTYDANIPSFPRLVSNPTESSLMVEQSLREPVTTSGSSSSSLSNIFLQEESLDINPDAIFSDMEFNGDWVIGGVDVDIDADLAMLEG